MNLPDWVKPGVNYWFNYPSEGERMNPHHGRKFQVRAIVDDRVVIREWWRSKRRWNYTVVDDYHFETFGHRIVLRAPAAPNADVEENQHGN